MELEEEVPVQHSATNNPPTTGTLGAAEREWIRKQGQVARAIEAARRRNPGRFSRRHPIRSSASWTARADVT